VTASLPLTGDDKVDRALQALAQGLREGERGLLAGAVLVEDVALTTSETRVFHGLGEPIRGWFPVRKSANAVVYEGTASSTPAAYINLRASAAVTVTLVFF
jgi:hypothetical protein